MQPLLDNRLRLYNNENNKLHNAIEKAKEEKKLFSLVFKYFREQVDKHIRLNTENINSCSGCDLLSKIRTLFIIDKDNSGASLPKEVLTKLQSEMNLLLCEHRDLVIIVGKHGDFINFNDFFTIGSKFYSGLCFTIFKVD